MLKYRFQINSNSIKGGRIIRCKGIESNFHYTRVRFMQGWARVRHFSIHQKYVLQTQVFYICSILANKNVLKSELQHWKSRYQELIFMLCRSHFANIVFLIDNTFQRMHRHRISSGYIYDSIFNSKCVSDIVFQLSTNAHH